jgi:hypothetical protein
MASSFLLCYVLAAILAAASDHGVPQDAYEINGRPVPAMALMAETDDLELEDLWTNLDDFPVPYSSSPEQFSEWLKAIKELVANNARQYYQPNVMLEQLEDMIQVVNADGYCSHTQMRFFLLANKVLASSNFKSLADYLNHFLPQKVANCAKKARKVLIERIGSNSYDWNPTFDDFYKSLFNLPREADDEQLYTTLKRTNLLKDDMNFAAGAMVAQSVTYLYDYDKIVHYFFKQKCRSLRNAIADLLDVILLSDAIEARVERDPRLLKLIEYDHACYYVTKNGREFMDNVRRQL